MSGVLMTKRPDERLDYAVDFSRWLPAGDSVVSSVNTITGSEATIDAAEVSGTSVTLWIEGGVDGETYTVSVEATTAQGRVKELCFRLRVRDC